MTLLLRFLPYLLGLGGVLVAYHWAWQNGYDARDMEARAALVAHVQRALAQAEAMRAVERELQEETDATLRNQAAELAAVNRRLSGELRRLRERPARAAELPGAARAECAGATGAELSGPDAGFLAREAARADRLRAGLKACYEYADSLMERDSGTKRH